MTKQAPYALVRFDGSGERTYLYENTAGLVLSPGDRVRVPVMRDGRREITLARVASVGPRASLDSTYRGPCREIIEKVEPDHRTPPTPRVDVPLVRIHGDPTMQDIECNPGRFRLQTGDNVVVMYALVNGENPQAMTAEVVGFANVHRQALGFFPQIVSRVRVNRPEESEVPVEVLTCPVVEFVDQGATRRLVCDPSPIQFDLDFGTWVVIAGGAGGMTFSGQIVDFRDIDARRHRRTGWVIVQARAADPVPSMLDDVAVVARPVPLSSAGPARRARTIPRPASNRAASGPIEPTKTKRRLL